MKSILILEVIVFGIIVIGTGILNFLDHRIYKKVYGEYLKGSKKL